MIAVIEPRPAFTKRSIPATVVADPANDFIAFSSKTRALTRGATVHSVFLCRSLCLGT